MKLDLDIRKTLTSATRTSATRTFTLSVQLQSDHERIVIVGPSGSGKSLTLQAIAGLLTPDAGHIRLEGNTLYDASSQICLPPQARRLPERGVLAPQRLAQPAQSSRAQPMAPFGGTLA